MKVSYDSGEAVHKDVYRNLMYAGNKYSFKGENGFDNEVGACTQTPNYTPYLEPIPPEPPAYWGLCFTAEEAGSTISMTTLDGAPEVHLQTSTDGETWTPFIVGETTITLTNVGDKVYFAATDDGNTRFATNDGPDIYYNKFEMTGKIAASGDITSLLDNSQSVTDLTGRNYCYNNMFNGCSSLTIAPELPATTLASNCYSGMFMGCTSLTTAPELPATTLVNTCYDNMFNGCTSLSEIEVNFIDWNNMNSTDGWLLDVSSIGSFKCPTALGTNETIQRGINNCPEGWTVVNT